MHLIEVHKIIVMHITQNSCEEAERRVQELVAAVERQQKLLETTSGERQAAEERLTNFETTNSFTVQELSKFQWSSNRSPYRIQCNGSSNRSPYRIQYNSSSNRSPYIIQCNSSSNRFPYRIQCNSNSNRSPYRIQIIA